MITAPADARLPTWLIALILTGSIACSRSAVPAHEAAEETDNMEELIMLAEAAIGPRYFELESLARRQASGDDHQTAVLERHRSDDNPVVALFAQVILDWLGNRAADYEQALAHLQRAPERAARTPRGTPSPRGVQAYLTMHFANRLTKLLALHQVKATDRDHWKVVAILLYLTEHRDAATTGALLRFAIETDNEEWRGFALDAVRAIDDPGLTTKLEFEVARARQLGRAVPAAVRDVS